MNREQKSQAVQEIQERFQKASITLLADYCGLNAEQMSRLRRELRENSGEIKVLKNTLAKRAIQGTEHQVLDPYFTGTIALVTSKTDPVGPAKVLVKFAKELDKPKIKAGFLSGSLLGVKDVESLSQMPSREELLAKLLGSMMAPAQNLVNVMSAVPRQLVTVLAAIRDKKS